LSKNETAVRPSFLYSLSFIGMAICVASSLGYQLQSVPLGTPFGLFGLLPVAFWIGIALMVASMLLGMRSGSETLFFVQSALLFLAIWGVPAFFEKYPTIWDSYMHYNSALAIANNGLVPTDPTFSYAYNYPGFFVLGASYSLIGNPPALEFLKYYPLFAALFTLAAIYLFVRTYVPRTDYRLVFLFAAFVNVWLQFNFSPQSLGLACGLLIFVCLEREGRDWRLAALVLFAFITIAHPTTLVFVMGAIILKEVFGRLYRLTFARNRPMRRDRPWPVGAFILIWLGWFFTGASSFSLNLVQFITERIQFLGQINESVANQWNLRATPENILGVLYPQLRTGTVGVFILLTGLAFIAFLLLRRKGPANFPKNILALFLIPFLIIPLDTLFFNGQLYDRGILYLVLVAPLIFIPLLQTHRWRFIRPTVAVAVVLVVVMCASTMFYQEALYIDNDRGIAASTFLANNAPNTFVAGGYYPYDVWSGSNEGYTRLKITSLYNQSVEQLSTYYGSGTYLFDNSSVLWYRQWGVMDAYNFYKDQAPHNYKVYDSGTYWVMYVPRSG
jgi:hypothetical protein